MVDDIVEEFLVKRGLDPQAVAPVFGLHRGKKMGREGIRYPTGCGVDRIKFIDGMKPKVLWWTKGGSPHFYNLERAREKKGDIWLVNGEPSVWACDMRGIPAVCTCGGETAVPSEAWIQRLASLDRRVNIVFDNDDAGLRGSVKLGQALLSYDVDVSVRRWDELLEMTGIDGEVESIKGFDVDDLHRIAGDDLLTFMLDMEIFPLDLADKPEPLSHSHWHLADVVCKRLDARDGPGVVYDGLKFYRYKRAHGVWREVEIEAINKETGSLDGHCLTSGDKAKYLSVSSSLIDSVRKCAQTQRYDGTFFDEAPRGIQFQNGFFNIDTMKLEESHPELRQRFLVDIEYDPRARCNLWKDALDAFFYNMEQSEADAFKDMLQEFAGAIACGLPGRVLFLKGGGENGKSTIIDVLSNLVPDEVRCSISPQRLADGHSVEYYIAQLAGMRLNVDADIPSTDMIESAAWKKSVTGDELMGRDPGGKPFRFRPRIIHLFSANNLPGTRDHSAGFWRRILVMPLERSFKDDSDSGVSTRLQKFRAEVPRESFGREIFNAEAAGIMTWAIEGALRLLRNNMVYTLPAASDATMDEWQTSTDQVATFIRERCNVNVNHWTAASDLFQEYKNWAQETSHGSMSSTSFGRRMSNLGFSESTGKKKRDSNGVLYKIAKLHVVPRADDDVDESIPF